MKAVEEVEMATLAVERERAVAEAAVEGVVAMGGVAAAREARAARVARVARVVERAAKAAMAAMVATVGRTGRTTCDSIEPCARRIPACSSLLVPNRGIGCPGPRTPALRAHPHHQGA